ncbi:MAG: type 4a pilus biogenesis protein PilO [Candidatus Hydrogenedentes bacterium]|nr:type 4a pilus biogenesis protein PilO [Candidatus Hydrogenedentota bacterium]
MREFLRGTVTPKDWMNVGVIVTIAAIIGAVFLMIIHAGQNERLAELESLDAGVMKDLADAHDKQAKIADLRKERDKMEAVVSEFEKRLPQDREVPRLLENFEGIAKEVGVEVSLKSLPRQEDLNKERIPFTITARGDFDQITGFINRLERYERYLKISELKIGKEEAGVSEATFTLSTFRFIEAKPGPAPAPAAPATGGGAAQ